MQKTFSYTKILHEPRIAAGLTCNQYVVADTINCMQGDGGLDGWCYATKEWFAELIGVSKQSILNLIDCLVSAGFVEKGHNGRHLRTTKKWENEIERFECGKESLPKSKPIKVKKVYQTSKESLPNTGLIKVKKVYQVGKESLPETVKKVSSEPVKKVYHILTIDTNIDINNTNKAAPLAVGAFSKDDLEDFEFQLKGESAAQKSPPVAPSPPKKKTEVLALAVSNFSRFDNPTAAMDVWLKWEQHKKEQFRQTYKSGESRQLAIDRLFKYSNGNAVAALEIINESRSLIWRGFFPRKTAANNSTHNPKIIDSSKYAKYE